ncbi:IQ and AAA domain-containing protein 1, partial [Ophiophagus hannah]
RRLEACHDQVVHPQKRLALRPLLESVLGRLLELKQELVELDLSEYHYMDHILEELKLTPVSQESGGSRTPPTHTHAPLSWN